MPVVNGTNGNDFIHRFGDGLSVPAGYNDVTGVTTGDDTIYGFAGDDFIFGDFGNDIIDGGTGADTMDGGAGNDWFYVDNAVDRAIEASAGDGYDRVVSSVSFVLGSHVEQLTLTGTSAINAFGNSIDNLIFGNDGNNILSGGLGADSMNGAGGNDIYYVDNSGDRAIEASAGGGYDRVYSSASFVLGNHVERLILTGTSAINGFGSAGTDSIDGNSANNILSGADSWDYLNGGGGNDHLYGGLGDDRLYGGAGRDRFIFNTALDPATNVDSVLDFSVVDDTIALDQTVFSALPPSGTLAASAFCVGTAAADADDRIIHDRGTGRIYYDADGNGAGAQVLFAYLDSELVLTNADFLMLP